MMQSTGAGFSISDLPAIGFYIHYPRTKKHLKLCIFPLKGHLPHRILHLVAVTRAAGWRVIHKPGVFVNAEYMIRKRRWNNANLPFLSILINYVI